MDRPPKPAPPFHRHIRGKPVSELSARICGLISQLRAVTNATAQRRLITELVKLNAPLCTAYARYYRGCGLDSEDLEQEARLGLLRAIDRYNPDLGFAFSTYAVWWIRHYLSRAVASHGRLVRVPVYQLDLHRRLADLKDRLSHILGRPATDEELVMAVPSTGGYIPGGKSGVTVDDVVQSNTIWQTPVSIDVDPAPEQRHGVFDMDRISFQAAPDAETVTIDQMNQRQLARLIRAELANLPQRDAYVVRMRMRGVTLTRIGRKLGLTRERVRQIQTIAIERVKRRLARKVNSGA